MKSKFLMALLVAIGFLFATGPVFANKADKMKELEAACETECKGKHGKELATCADKAPEESACHKASKGHDKHHHEDKKD